MEKMVVDNDTFFADVLQMLDRGRKVTIPVKGYSMLPFIRGGKDLVVLEKADRDALRVDDIVLFHVGPADGGRYVMHRIVGIDGARVDIMGDGVPKSREHVTRNHILARAVTILRAGVGKVDLFDDGEVPASVRSVDPYSPGQLRLVHFWQRLRPFRRYILYIYKRLPWNRSWIKENRNVNI